MNSILRKGQEFPRQKEEWNREWGVVGMGGGQQWGKHWEKVLAPGKNSARYKGSEERRKENERKSSKSHLYKLLQFN